MSAFFPGVKQAQIWYESADLAHDFEHVLRVLNLALKIGEAEGADLEIIHAAALLHDSRRAKPNHNEAEEIGHHITSAQFAAEVLGQAGWDSARINEVQHCIRAHRFRHQDGEQPCSIEAKCVFDADKLDVLGAVGVARTIAYATQAGQPFYARPSAQFLTTGQTLENEPYSAYHEYLFKLRKVKDRLFTLTGKAMAEERHAFLVQYFEQLNVECRAEGDYSP